MQESCGSPFAQAIHNVVTLGNHKKYLSFGIQLIDPGWQNNNVACLVFVRSRDGTDQGVKSLLEYCCVTNTGYSSQSICSLMVSDAAAVGVSSAVGMEERETCDMDDGDKVGQSATGRLVRSQRNVELNLFPAEVSLMKTSHKVGTFFSYSNCLDILHGIAQSMGVSQIIIQVDLNGTRIVAQHRLLFSVIRYVICLFLKYLFYNLTN